MKRLVWLWMATCFTACHAVTPEPQAAADSSEIVIHNSKLAAIETAQIKSEANPNASIASDNSHVLSESMMMPADAQKTKSGYAYVKLKPGTGEKPKHTDAVKIFLRVLNIEGTLIDAGETTLSMARSTPFLEEMLSVMSVGEQIRVWGESQARIWEIELLSIDMSFRAPEDVAAPPETAHVLNGFEDVRWRIIEPGYGELIQVGQAFRIHASRWNTQGEILESSKDGRGMLLLFNNAYAAQDPIHHAVLQQMRPGMRVRLWIPKTRLGIEHDLVEDFWIVERLSQLEPPSEMQVPTQDPHLTVIEPDKAWMRIEVTGDGRNLTDQSAVLVDMTCWNAETAQLIDATYLREKPDIMDIKPELGIWQKIMIQASVGTTLTAWIKKEALPENVGMDMTCRVQILDKAAAQENIAPNEKENAE